MSQPVCHPWRLVAIAVLTVPVPVAAQVETGSLVSKDVLVSTLPADSLYPTPRELVRAESGRLSTMTVRYVGGTQHGGKLEHRELFIALHARPSSSYAVYDRGTAALREDSLFRVLYIAEMDPGLGYIGRLETLVPPGARHDSHLLHVRYLQTGSGSVSEDLLFALDATEELVPVPIVHAELDALLEEGEYFCCGRFTQFDEDLIEFTVFVTRAGRAGVTHRVRSSFSLEGRFEFDAGTDRYVPKFRLMGTPTSGREPV